MDTNFGEFLKAKRQEKKLTQKELSKLLIISESAISKWEKNIAHPDITLLPKLSEILGVSEHELITASIDNKSREEKTQAKKWRAFSLTWSLFFYISYIIALIPCFICNLAIEGTLSWFWIVVSALILAFTFTNLPKLIKKHKLILLPLSMYLSLILLLGVCCIYTNGNWFWVASISVLLGLIIIFLPIYISRYKIFYKFRKFRDYTSIGIDFITLNILLIIIDSYCLNNYGTNHWYLNIALPITIVLFIILNILISIRFLKTNKLIKTSIVLFLITIFTYICPLFINIKNTNIQHELASLNVFKSNFFNWQTEIQIERNIHCIIFLTLIILSTTFLTIGLILHFKNKHTKNK